jgi:rSAM/selenodomain-associated transferase 1
VAECGQEKHIALHHATRAGTFYPVAGTHLEIAARSRGNYVGCLPGTRLIVFIRAPRAGSVKTRLAAGLGADGACAAYRQLIDHLMPAVRASGHSVELRHTPDDAGDELSRWREPGWDLAPQGAGDLGARLERAFGDSVAAGYERTLVVGTDCPYVTAIDLREAATALDSHEVVIGPASDGGYWLIGMRGLHRGLFRAIPWSSEEVTPVTLQRAQSGNLAVHRLRELGDIDTLPDWEVFERFLAVSGHSTRG